MVLSYHEIRSVSICFEPSLTYKIVKIPCLLKLVMVREQNHVYIEWKTNLQWLMKEDFRKTNACDYSLGTYLTILLLETI